MKCLGVDEKGCVNDAAENKQYCQRHLDEIKQWYDEQGRPKDDRPALEGRVALNPTFPISEDSARLRIAYFRQAWRIARDGQSFLKPQERASIPQPNGEEYPAQVGYIGPEYCGLVFCLMNHGKAWAEPELLRLSKMLANVSEDNEIEARKIFEELMDVTESFVPRWNNYSRFVAKVLEGTELTYRNIAYFNTFPFPTRGDSKGLSEEMLNSAVSHHGKAVMKDLEPRVVIVRYKSVWDAWDNKGILPSASCLVSGIVASKAQIENARSLVRAAFA